MQYPSNFQCAPTMVSHMTPIFNGQYGVVGLDLPRNPRVLDIGAHAGAFAIWALNEWPGAKVHLFEPNNDNFGYLSANLGISPQMGNDSSTGIYTQFMGGEVWAQKAAVTSQAEDWVYLYDGINNPGEASLFQLGSQSSKGQSVRVVSPLSLPEADFIKVDTEGSEVDILTHYPHLGKVLGVALEYHRMEDVPPIINHMAAHGLRIADITREERLLKFRRG